MAMSWNLAWISVATFPILPSPMGLPSRLVTGAISAAVPVIQTSSEDISMNLETWDLLGRTDRLNELFQICMEE